MKRILLLLTVFLWMGCSPQKAKNEVGAEQATEDTGQSNVQDDVSNPNVVQVAISSPDHTTLVAALKAAGYVDELSNAGPFTVFAPTNAAFDKLPEGTVETLVKPENRDKLRNILEYHVYVGSLSEIFLKDGMTLNQVNLKNVRISKKDGKLMVNEANIIGSVKAANGMVYVIDGVLLPEDKK